MTIFMFVSDGSLCKLAVFLTLGRWILPLSWMSKRMGFRTGFLHLELQY